MPVHEPHLARRALVGLIALVGCASNPPEPVQRTAAPEAAPAFDAPIIEAPAAAEESLAELEASLAVYEQQLARNEARLQAMGVRRGAAVDRRVPRRPRRP
jgi:hypothetical protein